MKKLLILVLCLCLVLILAACGKGSADPGMDAVSSALASAAATDSMMKVDADYIANTIKLAAGDYEAADVRLSNVGTNIDEYGVFKGKDSAQAAAIKSAVESYLKFRLDVWMSEYLPEEFPKLQNAQVWTEGNYVLYTILGDDAKSAAVSAFNDSFGA